MSLFPRPLTFALALLATAAPAAAIEDRILTLTGSPVAVDSFAATYQGTSPSRPRPEILVDLNFRNAADQGIVALDLRVRFYDAFNDELGRGLQAFGLISVEPGRDGSLTWSHSPYAAFRFERYGTAVAFVDRVRFRDGTIWKADRQEILTQMREIEDGLSIEDLDGIGQPD